MSSEGYVEIEKRADTIERLWRDETKVLRDQLSARDAEIAALKYDVMKRCNQIQDLEDQLPKPGSVVISGEELSKLHDFIQCHSYIGTKDAAECIAILERGRVG